MNSAVAPDSGTPKTPVEAPVEAVSGAKSVHKLAAAFEEVATRWQKPEHVALLKEFVDAERGIKHQQLLSDALQEHLDNSHALDLGTILTIAYLANDGLILREGDDEVSTAAPLSPQKDVADWDEVAQWGEQMGALSLGNAMGSAETVVAFNEKDKSTDTVVNVAQKVARELIDSIRDEQRRET